MARLKGTLWNHHKKKQGEEEKLSPENLALQKMENLKKRRRRKKIQSLTDGKSIKL